MIYEDYGSSTLEDGLYRVQTPYWVAGFVVRGGRITEKAPILKMRHLEWWMQKGYLSRVDGGGGR